MQPKSPSSEPLLFQAHFKQILDPRHPLVRLAYRLDWKRIEAALAECYSSDTGRPGCSTRLLVGLHYLKHAFDESDESVTARWVENPYWQYFCGYEYFQHECPLHPTTLVKWRRRVGAERLKVLLDETVATAVRMGEVRRKDLKRVLVDTTVQEKAVAYPTDARLYYKMLRRLVKLSRRRGLRLRQSYERLSKAALCRQGRYAHARQYKRAGKETRKLKTWLGRVWRELKRRAPSGDEELRVYLERAERLLNQERESKGKLYSIDAPEVECICKGKAHKRYEFGCKVSVSVTSRGSWVLSSEALHGNPYDGHTLSGALSDTERCTGEAVDEATVDQGYRGHDYAGSAVIYVVKRLGKKLSRQLRRIFRRRSAVEPVIGHLKSDNRLGRNYLKGAAGDDLNAVLSGAGYNLRKLLSAFLFLFFVAWRRIFGGLEVAKRFDSVRCGG